MIKKIPSSGHRMPSSTWFENHLGLTAGIGSIVNTMLLPGTAAIMARVVLRSNFVIAHGGGMRLKLVTVAAAMVAGMVFAPRQLI
jgi:hypothetical protein